MNSYSKLLDLALVIGALDGHWDLENVKAGDPVLREEIENKHTTSVMIEANKIMLEQLSFSEF